jgi:homoserine dehydrogenase
LRAVAEVPIERHEGAYYIRLMVVDRPGVIADVAAALRDEQVSMASMIRRGRAPGEAVPVVLTTHVTVEAGMRRALAKIAAHDTVLEPPRMIRIEDF